MKLSEIREMSTVDLSVKLSELMNFKFKLNFKHKTVSIKNTMELSFLKKEIAQINTILIEKKNNIRR